MDKTADKKWKCLFLLSLVALVISLVLGGSYLMSEPGQTALFKKALAIGFFALALVSFLAAKIGAWFFHGGD